MLELMRKHAKNWLMKFLLGMIIIVFIFYFGSRTGNERTQTVAVVDGKEIAMAEVQKEYGNLAEYYHQRYGGSLSEKMLKGLDLKQKALDSLISQAIIMQKAEELNLTATDDEVRRAIAAYPAFQRAGTFNETVYRQMLRANRMTPDEFEAAQQKMLSAAKLERLIQEAVKVSDQEVFDFFSFQNEQININYLLFTPAAFKGSISPSRKDLETYLKDHGNEFRVPEKVQIKAILFPGQDFADQAGVSEGDIADYYDRHSAKFAPKGEKAPPLAAVKAQIIAELAQANGMAAAAEQAKKAHDTIYQEENFDAYAAQNKLKTVTTDTFSLNSVPPPFNKVAGVAQILTELKQDEISKVFSDEEGYFFFKVASRKPAYTPELKDIEPEVARRYTETEARSRCKKAADAALALLKKGKALSLVAQENKLSPAESGFFKPGAAIPGLGAHPELSAALYQLSERNPIPERTFEVNGGFLVVSFKERGKTDTADYQTKKDNLKQMLLMMKRNEYFTIWLENTKNAMIKEGKLKIKKDLKDL